MDYQLKVKDEINSFLPPQVTSGLVVLVKCFKDLGSHTSRVMEDSGADCDRLVNYGRHDSRAFRGEEF